MSRDWPEGIAKSLTGLWERRAVFGSDDGIEGILWANFDVISRLLILSRSVILLGNEGSRFDRNTTHVRYRPGLEKTGQKPTCSCSP